ncbi:MAG: hypothetical protein GY714_31600 [Desulfobacterales bacterium]|nr:hypothetical protein [Desulfobacterales bacterium]MCP4160372.1 hypothetical protein [Deltaproteobacteria bacterium]
MPFLPDQGILLMGDTVETPFPVLSNKKVIPRIEDLKKWEKDYSVNIVVPSHGDIGGREIIKQNINYLESLLNNSDIEIHDMLTDFYKIGHQDNLRVCRDD